MGFKTEEQKRIQEERVKIEQQEIRRQEEEDLRHQEEMSANATEPATDPYTPETTYDPLKERTARTKNDIQQERGERSDRQRILDLHDQQRELEQREAEDAWHLEHAVD